MLSRSATGAGCSRIGVSPAFEFSRIDQHDLDGQGTDRFPRGGKMFDIAKQQ